MSRRFAGVWLAAALAVMAIAAPGVLAAKPTFERITVDETFADEFLTEECRVPVTSHVEGHITIRTFEGDGTGPLEVRTISARVTATAGDNTYRFRDVGADIVRVAPDGTEILMIVGQIPFGWTGVLKIDLTTGEVIHEPQHTTEALVEEACAALTA